MLVATPNDSHLPYVLKAAECGKNIIVEKPAALSSEETEKMYEAAQKAGVVFSRIRTDVGTTIISPSGICTKSKPWAKFTASSRA